MLTKVINGFTVLTVKDKWSKYYTWCLDHVGLCGTEFQGTILEEDAAWARTYSNEDGHRIWFRLPMDAAHFKLRWAGV